MSKIRLGTEDIKQIALFESMTRAKVEDFIRQEDTFCFVIKKGDMGQAIGKNGSNVARVRRALGRNVIVFEGNEDDEQLLRNMFHPVEVHGLTIAKTSGGTSAVVQISREDRSRAIGVNGTRIKLIKALAKRHCDIEELNLRIV